jgi:ParB/RepB/Spo0J family partition protein
MKTPSPPAAPAARPKKGLIKAITPKAVKPPAPPPPVAATAEQVVLWPTAKVLISTRNTRQPSPKDASMPSFAESIRLKGQLTPGIARLHPTKDGYLELAAGARRRVACEMIGQESYKVIIRVLSDDDLDELILLENLQREDPDPRAEAELLDKMVQRGMNSASISAHLGKAANWVERRLRLLKVIPALRKAWEKGGNLDHFSVDMMEYLGSLPADTQTKLQDNWQVQKCTSRADLEKYCSTAVLCSLDKVPFDLTDPRFFVKGCGPGCAHDSTKEGQLFDDPKATSCGQCLKPECFKARLTKARSVKLAELLAAEDLPVVSTEWNTPPIALDKKEVKPTELGWDEKERLKFKAIPEGRKVIVAMNDGSFKHGWLPKAGSSKSSSGGEKLKSPAKKEEEKREGLEGKRWTVIHGELLKALKGTGFMSVALTLPDLPPMQPQASIDELVAVFGTKRHVGGYFHGSKNAIERTAPAFLQGSRYPLGDGYSRKTPDTTDRYEALWESVKEVLEGWLAAPARVGDMPDMVPAMEFVAALIAFPLAERKLAVDLEILPPKSWGNVDVHTLKPVAASAPVRPSVSAPVKTATKAPAKKAVKKKGAK